jgi:N-methylhydantoinase B
VFEGSVFGPEREAWEAVFNDETMCELNRRLFALPKSVRYDKRCWIFSQAVPDMPLAGEPISLADVLSDPDRVRERLRAAMVAVFGSDADRDQAAQ